MATIKINATDDMTDKHIVINCRTGDIFACDTPEERDVLSLMHDIETAGILSAGK
jgi:hypothetical protein